MIQEPNAGRPAMVADTSYLAVVREALDELLVTVDPDPATSAELGLTRLTLHDADGEPIDELDGLLAEVRRRIAATHGGWVPPLGKDREASSAVTMMRGGNPKPTGLAPEVPTDEDLVALAGGAPAGSAAVPDTAPVRAAVLVGLVDTRPVDWATPVDGVQAWEGHASFVRDIVQAGSGAVDVRLVPALTGAGGTGTGWDVATAIVELVAEGVHILLLPLACFTADGRPPLLIERAIAAVPASTLIIAAAGNQTLDPGWSVLGRGPTNPAWPAALPRVKAVGVDPVRIDELAEHPPAVQPWVDALTDQVTFLGPFFHGEVGVTPGVVATFAGQAKWRGTSFSAAYAAGLVAARMSAASITAVDAWDALLEDGGALRRPPVPERS